MSNNIDFTTLKRWVPDYANASSIFVSGTHEYTMSATGFLSLKLYRYTGGGDDVTITVKVNSITVAEASSSATTANGARCVNLSQIIPVTNGDLVNVSYSNDISLQNIWFIPGKWV